MSFPEEYISVSNGQYYCTLCRPDKAYNKFYLFNNHIFSEIHEINVHNEKKKEQEVRKKLTGCAPVVHPKPAPKDDVKIREETLKKCMEDNKKMKEIIENQEKEISMLRNKMNDMMQVTIQKIKIYNEESDKLDKMVSDKKKALLNDLFGIV